MTDKRCLAKKKKLAPNLDPLTRSVFDATHSIKDADMEMMTGYTVNQLSRWRAGHRVPNVRVIQDIAQVVGVSIKVEGGISA